MDQVLSQDLELYNECTAAVSQKFLNQNGHSDESDWNGIVAQFQKLARDLISLVTHSFVDWWADMNTSLQSFESNLRFITTDGSNPFHTITVKERWVSIRTRSVHCYGCHFHSLHLIILTRSMWKTTITLSHTISSHPMESLIGGDLGGTRRQILIHWYRIVGVVAS